VEARAGSVVRVIGWSELPAVGEEFLSFETKRDAEAAAKRTAEEAADKKSTVNVKKTTEPSPEQGVVPIILKTDSVGSLQALQREIAKLGTPEISPRIISEGIGEIGESDAKLAEGTAGALIIGFNVGIDRAAKNILERSSLSASVFDIIYKLLEWLTAELLSRKPKRTIEEVRGGAKIIRFFSKTRDRQIVGGRVLEGALRVGDEVRIIRRDALIGQGKIRELQQQKASVETVASGSEFGALIQGALEIAPGDRIEAIEIITV
jgi:translation initiation factor IF-2